jgi:hypothetical protein
MELVAVVIPYQNLLSVSKSNSVEVLAYVPDVSEKILEHPDLKKAVVKRDGVCLCCWIKCLSRSSEFQNAL